MAEGWREERGAHDVAKVLSDYIIVSTITAIVIHFEMYIAFNTRGGGQKCPCLEFIRVRSLYFEFQFFVLIVLFMAGFRNATVSSIATILLNQFL